MDWMKRPSLLDRRDPTEFQEIGGSIPFVEGPARHPLAADLHFLGEKRHEGVSAPSHDWIREVREMRGRVLFGEGRCPSFRMPDGSFNDPDPLDLDAFHIIVRSRGRAIGCARILSLANAQTGTISSFIGERRFEGILRDLGVRRDRACEASRWIVAPEYRGKLGPRVVATTWAVGRWLPVEVGFVLAGTRQKQDVALLRMGAQAVPGLHLFPSETFDDDLRLLYFDVFHPSESMGKRMEEAAADLGLESQISPLFPGIIAVN